MYKCFLQKVTAAERRRGSEGGPKQRRREAKHCFNPRTLPRAAAPRLVVSASPDRMKISRQDRSNTICAGRRKINRRGEILESAQSYGRGRGRVGFQRGEIMLFGNISGSINGISTPTNPSHTQKPSPSCPRASARGPGGRPRRVRGAAPAAAGSQCPPRGESPARRRWGGRGRSGLRGERDSIQSVS